MERAGEPRKEAAAVADLAGVTADVTAASCCGLQEAVKCRRAASFGQWSHRRRQRPPRRPDVRRFSIQPLSHPVQTHRIVRSVSGDEEDRGDRSPPPSRTSGRLVCQQCRRQSRSPGSGFQSRSPSGGSQSPSTLTLEEGDSWSQGRRSTLSMASSRDHMIQPAPTWRLVGTATDAGWLEKNIVPISTADQPNQTQRPVQLTMFL